MKKIQVLKEMPYVDSLKELEIFNLEEMRLNEDMVCSGI